MSTPGFFEGSVPASYEKYSGPVLFEPFALDIVERIKNDRIENILELACGTGRVTRHLIKLVPPGGKLVASDISKDMMEVARSMIQDEKLEWQVVDAHKLPFASGSFDHVVCQFGMMFFQDKLLALTETNRVLQKGGTFIFNTWDSVESNPRAVLIRQVLHKFFDDAPAELTDLPHAMQDREKLKQLLESAGFKNIQISTVTKISYQHPDDTVNGFSKGSMISAFLAGKDPAIVNSLKEELKIKLTEAFGNNDMRFPLRALVTSCNK